MFRRFGVCALAGIAVASIPGSLRSAPFPESDTIRLTNINGVATWPGFARPLFVSGMSVRDERAALAGDQLGVLQLDRATGAVQWRLIQDSAQEIAMGTVLGFSAYPPSVGGHHWFGMNGPEGESGGLPLLIDGIAESPSGGRLSAWWRERPDPAQAAYIARVRVYDGQSLPPSVLSEWTTADDDLVTRGVFLTTIDGTDVVVLRRETTNPLRHWLEVRSAEDGTPLTGPIALDHAGVVSVVGSDGRVLLADETSQRIRMHRVTLTQPGDSFPAELELIVPGLQTLTAPAFAGRWIVAATRATEGADSTDRVAVYDGSKEMNTGPVISLPWPVQGRAGNRGQLRVSGDTLSFCDFYGAYHTLALSGEVQGSWSPSVVHSGQTRTLVHNGRFILADEGVSRLVRVVEMAGDGADPIELAAVPLEGEVGGMCWVGHIAYVLETGGRSSLASLDLSDPARPRISRRPLDPFGRAGLASDGSVLVAGALGTRPIRVFSMEIPMHPRPVAEIAPQDLGLMSFAGQVAVRESHGYVLGEDVQRNRYLVALDLRNPGAPAVIARHAVEGNELRLGGSRLWVSGYSVSGTALTSLQEFDVERPSEPISIAQAGVSVEARAVAAGDLLWLAPTRRVPSAWGTLEPSLQGVRLLREDGRIHLGDELGSVQWRTWRSASDQNGRKMQVGEAHPLGHLLIVPVGQSGFDVVEAGFVPPVAPSVSGLPRNPRAAAGSRVVLSASIDGSLPLSMRWYRNDEPLEDGGGRSGSRTGTLILDPAIPGDAGSYRLRVANEHGELLSEPVTLEVTAPAPLRLHLDPVGSTRWMAKVTGDPGQMVRIESSTDLKSWAPVGGTSRYGDPGYELWIADDSDAIELGPDARFGVDGHRYYRAVVVDVP